MADEKTPTGSNTAVPVRDHDRVAMLSLRADGTPDNYDPELIGDEEATKAATREQFRQQAVSVTDDLARRQLAGGGTAGEDTPEDPTVEALKDAHEKAEENANEAADSAVDALLSKNREADQLVVAKAPGTDTATATNDPNAGAAVDRPDDEQ